MAIELRIDNTGLCRVMVACVHCGEDIGDPGDGLAVWMSGREPDPVQGTVLLADYAHRACNERFLEKQSAPVARVATKINIPLAELFDELRQPVVTGHEDQNDREA